MNFFVNGNFKIQQSWQKRSNQSRDSKSKQRPKSKNNNKNNNSALYNAAKNMLEPSTDLLDDQVTKKILRDFAAQIPPPPSTGKSQKKIPINNIDKNKNLPPKSQKSNLITNDDSLLTSMASRLKQLQLTTKTQRQQIKQKTQTVQKLRTQNQFLKGLRSDSTKILQDMDNLKTQNTNLHTKIKQMQEYLKKYGVKWIGYNRQGKLDHQSLKNDIKKPKFNYRLPAEIDITTIQRRVQQLNANLQSQGMGTQVYNQNGIHKFRKAQALPMAFFGNGIAIKGFKFFPYKSKQSLQILSDLVDGYFPYVFKHKYPNGVFLAVMDKIAQKWEQTTNSQNINNFESVANKDFQPPSKQQFLNKLPKQVIKNGKVIQIRGAIQKKLNSSPQTIHQVAQQNYPQCEVSQQGHNIFLTTCYQNLKQKSVPQDDICTLKIRTHEGKVCVLHLQKQSKIKHVYQWMQKAVKINKFRLMGNYPKRIYQKQQNQTLQQLGLFPNAMLHVHLPQSQTK